MQLARESSSCLSAVMILSEVVNLHDTYVARRFVITSIIACLWLCKYARTSCKSCPLQSMIFECRARDFAVFSCWNIWVMQFFFWNHSCFGHCSSYLRKSQFCCFSPWTIHTNLHHSVNLGNCLFLYTKQKTTVILWKICHAVNRHCTFQTITMQNGDLFSIVEILNFLFKVKLLGF